jgi:hypothetical protein
VLGIHWIAERAGRPAGVEQAAARLGLGQVHVIEARLETPDPLAAR